MLRARLLACLLVAVAPLLSGCIGDEPTVALLVADGSDSAARAVDADAFTERVEATCDECRVVVFDAEGDAGTQKSQARQAEASSADAIVVDAVDPDDLQAVAGREIPLISLGTLVPGSERFVGLTGGDVPERAGSDLDAARDLVLGEEKTMSWVPTRAMSERAADVAVAFLADIEPPDGEDVDGVETWLYEEQDITLDNLTSVLVAQGILSLDDICGGETAKRCARLGLR
ncbi:hypothetical protein [Nocardioides hwasunensis]|uniref:Uncharacterized protein n=1 Tax=Nocardioides hwasunensis TaxID=397258 RepID=A0ABR8ME09_9ACTN|nr:hypothetical protein [Nocardioides hwasunensis]MBD3914103.1 hypothetical protein [Nocardioides hwasunensis]